MARTKISTDEKKIDELLSRGVAEVIVRENLKKKLLSGKQLRVKLGIDPTSPHLHLGRSVPILKLRDFEELGHQVVFIVGDFTGVIGDTSDKDSERPMLEKSVIDTNKKTYFAQVAKLLDIKKAELHYNSEWLSTLKYADIGAHADVFSVSDFIARENIQRRLERGVRVSLREMLYPLMQGYDSVAVKADVELGGTDQKFNLLAGRALQERFGQAPQDIVMNPMFHGLDGRKMSSSWGNTINLTALPNDMYGKVMSMNDAEILTYFTMCTRVPLSDIEEMDVALKGGMNPRDAKMKLAREIVMMYHSKAMAIVAERVFVETFQKRNIPDEITAVSARENDIENTLVKMKIVVSKNELMRLLRAGGVRNAETGEKINSFKITFTKPLTLRIGKRRFIRLDIKKN